MRRLVKHAPIRRASPEHNHGFVTARRAICNAVRVDGAAAPATGNSNSNTRVGACDADAKAFTMCMDDYKGDMTACSWYLDQLKVIRGL